jgi:hypothetical protein
MIYPFRLLVLGAGLGLISLGITSCKPFDDDLSSVPNWVADYIVLQTDSARLFYRNAVSGLDIVPTDWVTGQWKVTQVGTHPEREIIAYAVSSPPALVVRSLEYGSRSVQFGNMACEVNHICFGRRHIAALTNPSDCRTLRFFPLTNSGITGESHNLTLSYHARAIAYRQGRFLVASDSVLYIYSDDAATLQDTVRMPFQFVDMTLVPGFALQTLGLTNGRYQRAEYDVNGFQFRGVAASKYKRQVASPIQKSYYEMEYLGNVYIDTLNRVEVRPSAQQPFPVQGYGGQASYIALDYLGARLFYQSNDTLYLRELKTGYNRVLFTRVQRVLGIAHHYETRP